VISRSSASIDTRQLVQVAQLVARDPDACALLGACQAPRDPGVPLRVEQAAAGDLQLGPEVMQMPQHGAVERHPRADQALPMIDQQSQVQLRTGQLRGRKRLDALGDRRAGDRQRVDTVGLAALAAGAPSPGHQLRRNAHDAFAVFDQKPLKRSRDVAAVLKRPHAFLAQPAAPLQ
jgi:hypothetical protein